MPALIESEHPACAGLIREYKACSAEASLLSKVLFSECTALKYRLDACFRQEKIARTKHNIAKGKEVQARLQAARRARDSGES